MVFWPSTCLLKDRALAIHAWKAARTPLPVSLFLMPPTPSEPQSALPAPTGSIVPNTCKQPSCPRPQVHFLDGPRCYSHGPRAVRALLPSQGCFPPCQIPSLILGACHSQLPASHPGPGKEMRPRNSGAEPPTAREMLTHSQCILTQGNSQQSQRAVPGLPGAQLSVLLPAWN